MPQYLLRQLSILNERNNSYQKYNVDENWSLIRSPVNKKSDLRFDKALQQSLTPIEHFGKSQRKAFSMTITCQGLLDDSVDFIDMESLSRATNLLQQKVNRKEYTLAYTHIHIYIYVYRYIYSWLKFGCLNFSDIVRVASAFAPGSRPAIPII